MAILQQMLDYIFVAFPWLYRPAYLRHYYCKAHCMTCSLTKKIRLHEHSLQSFSAVSNIQNIFPLVSQKTRGRTRKTTIQTITKVFDLHTNAKNKDNYKVCCTLHNQRVEPIITQPAWDVSERSQSDLHWER